MKRFRGTDYEERSIENASRAFGYVYWPKLMDDRCYGDTMLGDLLAGSAAAHPHGAEYVGHVQAMAKSIRDSIKALKRRHISCVRLGASWAEADTPGGLSWMKWYFEEFSRAGFEILPCLNYTPARFATARIERMRREAEGDLEHLKKIAELQPLSNIPPEPLDAFADYVRDFIRMFGKYLRPGSHIELWNEPNINTDWNPEIDTDGRMFVDMLAPAAQIVRESGFKVLLGGLTKFIETLDWLERHGPLGVLDHADAVGFHILRGTWSEKRPPQPLSERIAAIKATMRTFADRDIPVFLDEVGFATLDLKLEVPQEELEEIQAALFADTFLALADGSAAYAYWYSAEDKIVDSVRFITTGWEDILQYFFGDTDMEGNPKLLRTLLEQGGPIRVLEYIESRNAWDRAYEVIDRGTPYDWSVEQLKSIVEQMKALAHERTLRTAPKKKEAA